MLELNFSFFFLCKCLVKLTRCPVTIETNSNPLRSGTGKLPYLQIGNEKFVGYRKIKALLDKEVRPMSKIVWILYMYKSSIDVCLFMNLSFNISNYNVCYYFRVIRLERVRFPIPSAVGCSQNFMFTFIITCMESQTTLRWPVLYMRNEHLSRLIFTIRPRIRRKLKILYRLWVILILTASWRNTKETM